MRVRYIPLIAKGNLGELHKNTNLEEWKLSINNKIKGHYSLSLTQALLKRDRYNHIIYISILYYVNIILIKYK